MIFHDIILKGPFGEVRMDWCDDESIKGWIQYGLSKGATKIETMPSEAL